jgi:hypothetical protein
MKKFSKAEEAFLSALDDGSVDLKYSSSYQTRLTYRLMRKATMMLEDATRFHRVYVARLEKRMRRFNRTLPDLDEYQRVLNDLGSLPPHYWDVSSGREIKKKPGD